MNIAGKKISVIGAERSGVAAAKLAKKKGAVPFVSDSASLEKLKKSVDQMISENIMFECGEHSPKVFDCDFIITSPGVPSSAEVLMRAKQKGIYVISEVEFAFQFCEGKVISITGTNGKTTTTSLCDYALNSCGFKSYSAGNIGLAFSEIAVTVKSNEFVCLETSSFQLDYIDKFKPKFAAVLNITPDHLDRYDNEFANYIAAKLLITKNQIENDYFIYNYDDKIIPVDQNKLVRKYGFSLTNELPFGSYLKDNIFYFSDGNKCEAVCSREDLYIKGEHNTANALCVLTIVKLIGCDNDKIVNAFRSFKGVEHRLEFVREFGSVTYINDSKATNVDSVWYALQSFTQPIILILGGKDKGNDYNKIKSLVESKVKKIYAIGSSAQKVFNFFEDIVKVEIKKSLEECVHAGRNEAEENDIVLLSPACASFDMFDNYEHRGKIFKQAVNDLI